MSPYFDRKGSTTVANKQLTNALADVDLFSGLPDAVLRDIVEAGTVITTSPGKPIVTQGASDAGLQVILEGSASISVNGSDRGEIGPGSYFGEISVIDGKGRSASITASDEGLKTFAISALSLSPLIDKHPSLSRALLKALAARVRELDESV
jgi:CRP-like cAMP-binding protein